MNNISKKIKTLSITSLLVCFTGVSQTASADIGLPDTPLFLGTSVPLNIFLAMDDSGSMDREVLISAAADAAHGSPSVSDQRDFTPDTNQERREACAAYNVSAYDPGITYTPWVGVDEDSNAYADMASAATSAWTVVLENPYDSTGGTTTDITAHVYYVWTDGDVNANGSLEGIEAADGNYDVDECLGVSVAFSSLTTTEKTNYANYYSYYRDRDHVFKRAASELITNSVSYMGLATQADRNTVGTPISTMTGASGAANKDNLLQNLFEITPGSSGGTPLRQQLERVGEYFDTAGSDSTHNQGGTLGRGLGFNDPSPILTAAEGGECQQNFAIVMSDGYWGGSTPLNIANNDGDDSSTFDTTPTADSVSDTLADVAMKFYELDLDTGLANNVPESTYTDPTTGITYTDDNPAQHLVTYTVSLGLIGNNLTTPVDHDAGTAAPPWTDPIAGGDEETLDDMQHAAFNGRGLFLSASNTTELIDSLNDALGDIDTRTSVSGSAIAINSTVLKTTSFIFQASFNSVDWTGDLSAFSLNADGTVNQEEWSAAAKLPTVTSASDRNHIFTSVSTGGIEFVDTPVNAELVTAIGPLTVGATTYTEAQVIQYIRGDQTNEGAGATKLRVRAEILGDVVSSSPISIGEQDLGYDTLPGNSGVEGTSYSTFLAAKNSTFTDGSGDPLTAVYVGANDGMLHAFRDAQSTSLQGQELFAYIPSSLHGRLSDLADPAYGHKFYVNGAHTVGDACIGSGTCTWKSILVGTLGEGGRTVYALDVTDPFNFDASDVLWEYNFDDTRTGTTNSGEMGFIKGAPQVVRLNNGKWGVVFGNGYNSDSDTSRIFILDAEDGTEIIVMDTQLGDSSNENGMATPLIVDEDGDRIADTIYSGDLFGNLYKFDISGTNPLANNGGWESVFLGTGQQSGDALPLFPAVDGNGDPQPITTKPTIVVNPESGFNIIFGTGKYIETSDTNILTPYQIETMYSIWDDDVDGNLSDVDTRGDLIEQTIDAEVTATVGTVRIVSENPIDYTGNSPDKGWFMDALEPGLASPFSGERIIADPLARFGRAIFVTFIPPDNPCDPGGSSVLMEIDALSGARLEDSVFDTNGDGIIDDADFVTLADGTKVPASGIYIPGTLTSPAVISLGDPDQEAKQLSGIDSESTTVLESTGGTTVGRQSWRQLK